MLHIVSWSGGKDSTATVILLHEHRDELIKEGDEVVILFSEIMFDKKNNISGHIPQIIDFVKETSEIFNSWGFKVEILHAEKDFLDIFYHRLSKSKDKSRIGLTYGFPIPGLCAVKRDCKIKPIDEWKKAHSHEAQISYVGIAKDEPLRLESLKRTGQVSLLDMYGFTESDAKNLCERYNLLSPQYQLNEGKQNRDGCWFCPWSKPAECKAVFDRYPEAWEKFVSLENEPNLAFPYWNALTKETLKQRDLLIREA